MRIESGGEVDMLGVNKTNQGILYKLSKHVCVDLCDYLLACNVQFVPSMVHIEGMYFT